jgi:predicted nucleic acid-binding protein
VERAQAGGPAGECPRRVDRRTLAGPYLHVSHRDIEMLHSARNAAEFAAVEQRHARLREVPLTQPACLAAVAALRELAAVSDGFHRVRLGDALIVASAQDAQGVGVLHYNHTDFEKLGDVLGSMWLR